MLYICNLYSWYYINNLSVPFRGWEAGLDTYRTYLLVTVTDVFLK